MYNIHNLNNTQLNYLVKANQYITDAYFPNPDELDLHMSYKNHQANLAVVYDPYKNVYISNLQDDNMQMHTSNADDTYTHTDNVGRETIEDAVKAEIQAEKKYVNYYTVAVK